ncbi:MAG: SH3 domain-containing protein [Lachnospiraceae bacterium]|nr:SH3 domain-containing protein [Lachnospiraceae bacterium]
MKHIMKKSCIAVLLAAVMMIGTALSVLAADATVNSDGTRIRSDSSTDSSVVVTAGKGTTYTVLDTVTGGDGNTWYKVQVSDGQTGFVRGDLVTVSGDASDSSPEEVTSSAPTTPIQPMNVTTKETANIRSGAGTDYSRVGKIESGTEITVTGEAMASDGYKWYEMNCESKGVSGFIRSDFVEIDESAVVYSTGSEEAPEDTQSEEPAPEEDYSEDTEEHKDYEIVYAPDDDGVYQYYLYNHIDSTKQKVESLLEMVNTLNDKYKEANKKLSTFKLLTIVFGILMVLAAGLAVFFFLRSRADYEYYEEDFEEKQPEAPKKRPAEGERERERPARRSQGEGEPERARRNPERQQEARDGRRSEERPSEKNRPEARREDRERAPEKRRPAPEQGEERSQRKPRKPQNFLANDDDLEFEFLDMDE